METFLSVTGKLAQGFGTTLALFFLTLLFAIPLGLLFACISRMRFKPLRFLMRAFIYIIRGTPLLLQLMIVVYLPGIVFGHPLTKWEVFHGNVPLSYFCGALFAFVINYACYFAEIFRGGIENIPKGQYEACEVFSVVEIYFAASEILRLQFIIWPLFYTGAFYLGFSALVTLLFGLLEKKLSRYWR